MSYPHSASYGNFYSDAYAHFRGHATPNRRSGEPGESARSAEEPSHRAERSIKKAPQLKFTENGSSSGRLMKTRFNDLYACLYTLYGLGFYPF